MTLRRTRSERLLARLARVESPDVTFLGEKFPIVMHKAKGMRVVDADGNRYSDFTACFGVLALGHGSTTVRQALRKQSAHLIHGMGDVHPTAQKIRLLEILSKIAPFPMAKSILGLNGSDAVDAALKTSMLVTNRSRFLSFAGGYHGLTLGPLVVNPREHFTRGFEAWTKDRCTVLPFPATETPPEHLCSSAPFNEDDRAQHRLVAPTLVLERLEKELRTGTYAALILEPLQGRGGERDWPSGFLKECEYLCRKWGTLLICDEIFSGLGRTGSIWAHTAHGITPNLLCTGKALGGGLPLSACVGDCMDVWGKSEGEARHTSTFLGHPLACAVAGAVVEEILNKLPTWTSECSKIDVEFQKFAERHTASGKHHTQPFIVRGRGFMRGLWFYKAPPGYAASLSESLLERGFLTLPSGERGDVLSLTPPLTSTASDFRKIFATLSGLV